MPQDHVRSLAIYLLLMFSHEVMVQVVQGN